jgi:hypothetical protein
MKDLTGREIDFNELAEEQNAMEREMSKDYTLPKGTRVSYEEKSEEELVRAAAILISGINREQACREKN